MKFAEHFHLQIYSVLLSRSLNAFGNGQRAHQHMHQNEIKLLEPGELMVIHCTKQPQKKPCMFDSPFT